MTIKSPQIDTLTTVAQDGSRNFLHPAHVNGRFTKLRQRIFVLLIALLVALPFIQIGDYPAVWLDVPRRQFHLFGFSLGPSDSYLLFFLLTAVGFVLVVVSALWGRIWCGYACPQTVFLEGVFRRIERWIDGTRDAQIRLEKAPLSGEKIFKRVLKYTLFAAVSLLIAHLLLCYFVSFKTLWQLMRQGPASEPAIFIWAMALSVLIFFNFVWFREQLCIIICPYGRLQSVLCDHDTLVVAYDQPRGEPRGKVSDPQRGACIDCQRCVQVCPTGIDIRHGTQLECVGCANCIDACDEIMVKIGQPTGLVRYASEREIKSPSQIKRRWLTPRLSIYAALALLGVAAFGLTWMSHPVITASLIRQAGAPFTLEAGRIRNGYLLHIQNQDSAPHHYTLQVQAAPQMQVVMAQTQLDLAPYEKRALPLFVSMSSETYRIPVLIKLHIEKESHEKTTLSTQFIGP